MRWTLILLVLVLSSLVVEASDEAIRAVNSIAEAERDLEIMKEAGLKTIRYNDLLGYTKEIFDVQYKVEQDSGKEGNYVIVHDRIRELKQIKSSAFRAYDELIFLEEFVNNTEEAAILELYNLAKLDYEEERYEVSLENIDKTYEKISEMQALETKLKVFYQATSRGLINFLKTRWREVLVVSGLVAIALFFGYSAFKIFLIRRKINFLELRKGSIQRLVAKTQSHYFEKGNLSESIYHVRMKKYTEIARDINRQIPLLNEKMAILKKKNEGKEEKIGFIKKIINKFKKDKKSLKKKR